MILRGAWRQAAMVGAMCVSSVSRAGTWGVDPVVGVVGYHSTNPILLAGPHTDETRGAVLVDSPVTYTGNGVDFAILPSFRVGDSIGFSSLTSNYEHLNFKGDITSERDVVSGTAGVSSDSSLYYNYTQSGLAGVSREAASADLSWSRRLTERMSLNADLSDSRVGYGHALGAATLVDYSYAALSSSVTWDATETSKLTFKSGATLYKSLDDTTKSTDIDLQMGWQRRLSDIWSVTALAGLSRTADTLTAVRENLIFTANGPTVVAVPVRIESSQNSTIYSTSATRQGERLMLNVGASRQLIPSGFSFLSRQESYDVGGSYACSVRWKLSADLRLLRSQDPSRQGVYSLRTVRYATFSSAWQWTAHWTITVAASRVTESLAALVARPSSTEVSLQLSRQFDRIKF